MKKKAVIYTRVLPDDDQSENSLVSLENQKLKIIDYCKRNDLEIFEQFENDNFDECVRVSIVTNNLVIVSSLCRVFKCMYTFIGLLKKGNLLIVDHADLFKNKANYELMCGMEAAFLDERKKRIEKLIKLKKEFNNEINPKYKLT